MFTGADTTYGLRQLEETTKYDYLYCILKKGNGSNYHVLQAPLVARVGLRIALVSHDIAASRQLGGACAPTTEIATKR
jgi:hypothetical protein